MGKTKTARMIIMKQPAGFRFRTKTDAKGAKYSTSRTLYARAWNAKRAALTNLDRDGFKKVLECTKSGSVKATYSL